MEQNIGGLDILDKHGRRMICQVLYIIEDASHVEERRICVVWYNKDESRQGNIVNTLLQVEDDWSDVIHDLIGAHGTARSWEALLAMGVDAQAVDAAERWNNCVGRRQLGWKT